MNYNNEKAEWKALDIYGIRHRGEVRALMDGDWSYLEARVFEEIKQLKPLWVGIKFENSSGAGQLREYEKKGPLWFQVRETSFLPRSAVVSLFIYRLGFALLILIVLSVLAIIGLEIRV